MASVEAQEIFHGGNEGHGTVRGYIYYRCRCDECRKEYSAYKLGRKADGKRDYQRKSNKEVRIDAGMSVPEWLAIRDLTLSQRNDQRRSEMDRKLEERRIRRAFRFDPSGILWPNGIVSTRSPYGAWTTHEITTKDPTGDAAVESTTLTRANIQSIGALLLIAKRAPIIPDNLVERFIADEIRLIVVNDGEDVEFVMPKCGWDDADLWHGEALLPRTAVVGNAAGMRHHGGGRGHKGHAKAAWKGHVSKSAKGRKTKDRS